MPRKIISRKFLEKRQHIAKVLEIRVPRWWSGEVKTGVGVISCTKCKALFYDKHWHAWENASSVIPKGHKVTEAICPACKSLSSKGGGADFGFAGEVILSGLNNVSLKLEVIRTAKNIAERAVLRDPEAQIIKIEDKGRTVRITTTKNTLAEALGKEIDASHKGGELSIRFSEENLPVRVYWTAKASAVVAEENE